MEVSTTYENVLTDSGNSRVINRYRVVSGWIVEVNDTANNLMSLAFVPDPKGEWEIG